MLQNLIQSGRDAQRTGAWDQAIAHYRAAMEMLPAGEEATRADLLRSLGTVHRDRGELGTADDYYEESRQVATDAGLKEKVVAALIGRGGVGILRGDTEAATEIFLQSREAADELGEDQMVAIVDQNLAVIANIQGNVSLALLSYRSALERYRRLGDESHATMTLNNMGMAHVDLMEWGAAEACFDEAAEIAGRTGNVIWTGRVDLNRTELHLKRKQFDHAQESCERSLRVFHRLRAKPSIAEAYKFYGILYRETGRMEQADSHFALSLGMAETCQNKLLQAETQMEWAILQLTDQRPEEGVLRLNGALRLFREMKARREALDIERRLSRLEEIYLPTVGSWGADLSQRNDAYQVGHTGRVAEYATKLAREVGIEGWDLTVLRIGALIHDLGNSAVPSEVLSKSDELDLGEREIMRVHTVVGEAMAHQLGFPEEAKPYVRSHHEQWAGTGYPDNLAGEKIPLGVRILSIADVYDAITSPRSFRPARSREDALHVIGSESGKMFDPKLVDVFRDMMLRGTFDDA